MDITYPNYSVENFNDTRSSRLGKSVLIKNFKKYAEMFPDDQEIQWVASERLSGSTPTYLQKAYTNGGYYILRNKWDDQSMMMILKNNNVNQITVHLVYIKEDVISSLTQGHTHTVGAIERAIAKQPDITR